MNELTLFVSSFLIGFSGAASPGPLLIVTIRETFTRGLAAPFLIIAGHAILELFATAGLAFGVGRLMSRPFVPCIIGLGGGAVMIFLASGTIRDGIKGVKVDLTPRATESGNPSRLIGLGIVVTLSNPYWTLWWLTIGASLISASASGNLKSIGAFYTGHILADFVWYGMVGAGVVWGGRFLAGRAYGMLLVALGGLLGLFGCYFLLKGAALIR